MGWSKVESVGWSRFKRWDGVGLKDCKRLKPRRLNIKFRFS